MQEKIDLFSQLLRELEAEIGTRDVADMMLRALMDSVESLKCEKLHDFCLEFEKLVEVISNTEPKFGILNYHLANLAKEIKCKDCNDGISELKWKKMVVEKIREILNDARKQKFKLVEHSNKLKVEGKTILIHDHSHTVQDILLHYRKIGMHFKVVIAEQDFEKSHGNIEKMHGAGIPFQVVPSYMLSHVHEQIDMLFFGALTLKDSMDFVMDPGTHSIISEFHVSKKPIYMFINITKFSLWKSKKRGDIFIHKHVKCHHSKAIEYERIKYSHDRVPAELFEKIITNEGIFSPKGIKELFNKKLKEYGH